MPNWVYNELRVTGPTSDLADFVAHVRGNTEFDYNTIAPYPKEYEEADKRAGEWYAHVGTLRKENPTAEAAYVREHPAPQDGFNHGGYEWCLADWGAKWSAVDVKVDHIPGEVARYRFESPWSPPNKIVATMSKLFPTLTFHLVFDSWESDFWGQATYKDGTETNTLEGWSKDAECMAKDGLPVHSGRLHAKLELLVDIQSQVIVREGREIREACEYVLGASPEPVSGLGLGSPPDVQVVENWFRKAQRSLDALFLHDLDEDYGTKGN